MLIPFLSGSDLRSYHSHPEATSDHTISRPKVTPDQTIPIRKRPLIRPFPSASDIGSDHSHLQVTYDQTILIRKQNTDPVIMVWEHTVCVGLRMIEVTSGWHLKLDSRPMCLYSAIYILVWIFFPPQKILNL